MAPDDDEVQEKCLEFENAVSELRRCLRCLNQTKHIWISECRAECQFCGYSYVVFDISQPESKEKP